MTTAPETPAPHIIRGRFLEARRAALLRQGKVPYSKVLANQETMKSLTGAAPFKPQSRAENKNSIFGAKTGFYPMRGGNEHRVFYLGEESGRVMKAADTGALATESLYDYLTDHRLSNYFFGDDLQLAGSQEEGGRAYVFTSQPYIDGTHPDWEELKNGLTAQGLHDPSPLSKNGNFVLRDEVAGEIEVIDLHVNNVVRDASGWLHPIDAHFYFHDREARMAVLEKLGLNTAAGPASLASAAKAALKK